MGVLLADKRSGGGGAPLNGQSTLRKVNGVRSEFLLQIAIGVCRDAQAESRNIQGTPQDGCAIFHLALRQKRASKPIFPIKEEASRLITFLYATALFRSVHERSLHCVVSSVSFCASVRN